MLRFLTAGESHGQTLVMTLDGMPADEPEEKQPPRDLARFVDAFMLQQPGQRAAMILQVVAHTVQPLGLPRSNQRLSCKAGFVDAVPCESVHSFVALARRRQFE